MRAMGIDYGFSRIGIALSDVMQIMSNPFQTIESISIKKNAQTIVELAKNNDVSVLIVGLPINMDGTESKMAQTVKEFIEEIRKISDIEIKTIDERLTTVQAERMLVDEADISRSKRKGLKDKVAASLILQTYLDTKGL